MIVAQDKEIKNKVIPFDRIESTIQLHRKNKRIVHCHGVFDVLHIGHIRHFQKAKALGDILVVSVTPDIYVNKGPNRPAFTQTLRAEMLASLDVVDFVIINKYPTAIEIIHLIKPDIYTKGIEYKDSTNDITGKIRDEQEAVEAFGGKIEFTDDITFSSSSLINQNFTPFSSAVINYLNAFKYRVKVPDILKYLDNAKQLKVAVIGEAIIDEYVFSEVLGKAGKEPVLVAKKLKAERYAGGVLAIANHLSDFVDSIDCFTMIGEKSENLKFIKSKLKSNIHLEIINKINSPTIVKRRFVENHMKQKIFEVYEINDTPLVAEQQQNLEQLLQSKLKNYDLVIVADYGHGFISGNVIKTIIDESKFLSVNVQANAGNHGFNCISKYAKADYICIAQRELALTYRCKCSSPVEYIQMLLEDKNNYKNIMVTDGRKGSVTYKSSENQYKQVPALAYKVKDRIGAGDAVLAITSLCMVQGASAEISGFIGNVVGAEAVAIMCNKHPIGKISLKKHITHLLK